MSTFLFSILAFLDSMIIDIIPGYGKNNVGYHAACITIASILFITQNAIIQTLDSYMAATKDSVSMQLVVNKAFKSLVITVLLQGGFITFFVKMFLPNFGPSYINYVHVLRILIIGYSVSMFPSISVFFFSFTVMSKCYFELTILFLFQRWCLAH